jgi:uncharacterized protein YkwD
MNTLRLPAVLARTVRSFPALVGTAIVLMFLPACDELLTDADSDEDADTTGSDAGNGALDTSVQETTDDEPEDDWPADWRQFEQRVLELVNEERAMGAVCGGEAFGSAPPLTMDPLLTAAARGHSRDMAELDFFDHDSPDGREFSDRIEEAGFNGAFPWGENIAAGYANPQQVVDGWMESPGHCSNIMDPGFGLLGVGYFYDDSTDMGSFWTQNFAGRN